MQHEVFNHETFPEQFKKDLNDAVAVVLIHTPYATAYGLNRFREQIVGCLSRNVRVCFFLLQPENWINRASILSNEGLAMRQLELVIREYEQMGVHVTLRTNIHEKVAVIDDQIAYDGSLNFLSYRKTSERTTRWVSHAKAQEMICSHGLDRCSVCLEQSAYDLYSRSRWTLESSLRSAGQIVSCARKQLKRSQRELAREIGTQQCQISNIETGAHNVCIVTLLKLCRSLDLVLIPLPRTLVPILLVLAARLRPTVKP